MNHLGRMMNTRKFVSMTPIFDTIQYFSPTESIRKSGDKKMKLFHSNVQYYKMMGIDECDAFGWKNLLFLAAILQFSITSCGFIVLSQAESAAENAFAFFQAISGFASVFAFLIFTWRKHYVFELIRRFESFIEESEF